MEYFDGNVRGGNALRGGFDESVDVLADSSAHVLWFDFHVCIFGTGEIRFEFGFINLSYGSYA